MSDFSLNPAKGYNTAANYADQAAFQYDQQASDQWNRQMGGLAESNRAYNPSRGLVSSGQPGALDNSWSQYGGQFAQAGAGENAFNKAGWQYQQPGSIGTVADQARSGMGQQSQMQQGQGTANSYLLSNKQNQTFSDADRFRSGPTQQGTQYDTAQYNLGGPSQSQDTYGGLRGQLGSEGMGEQYYRGASQQMGGPGSAENFYSQNQQRYNDPQHSAINKVMADNQYGYASESEKNNGNYSNWDNGPAQQFANTQAKVLNGPGALQQASGDLSQRYNNVNDSQSFAQRQGGNLETPGMYENFAQSTLAGNNPYFDQIKKEGMDSINQQMIARGSSMSGAAGAALAKYGANIDNQNFMNKSGLAQGAQQMGLQRLQQGQGLAGQVSAEKMGQAGALQGLAQGQEGEFMNRQGQIANAVNTASSERLGMRGQQLQADAQADQSRMARMAGMTNLAQATSANDLGMLNAQSGAAQNAQSATLARQMGLGSLANSAQGNAMSRYGMDLSGAGQQDQQSLARQQALFGMAQSGDQNANQRMQMYMQGGQGADAQTLAQGNALFNQNQAMDQFGQQRLMNAGNLSNMQDQYGLNQLNSYMSSANAAQDQAYQRQMGMFNTAGNVQAADQAAQQQRFAQQYGIDNANANLTNQFYGRAGDYFNQNMNGEIEAGMNAGMLRGQGQMALGQTPYQWANLGVQGYKASQGGGKG